MEFLLASNARCRSRTSQEIERDVGTMDGVDRYDSRARRRR
jgi:hypothetical protein